MLSGRKLSLRPFFRRQIVPSNHSLLRGIQLAPAPTTCTPRLTRFFTSDSVSESSSGSQGNYTGKPYYITTPIFYPNAVPHVGHLYSLVTADIFARFARITHPTRPVVFLAGTDEHGLKIQKAAQAHGLEPRELCDRLSAQFRNLAEKANVSYTTFQRTTDAAHREAVEHVWRILDAKGLIFKGTYEGWYSVTDECFYTDAQVTHITPSAKSSSEPTSISSTTTTTIATETGSPVEWSSEVNYKFRLSAFREPLLAYYRAHPESVFPPAHRARVIRELEGMDGAVDAGVGDLSISRPRARLSWGIPVPGDPAQTIYVWFDALIVYLTGVGYPCATAAHVGRSGNGEGLEEKNGAWPPNVQVIGKDIVRFHAIYLPAMLHALDLPPSRALLAHAHWTAQQKKMSKSLGNVADPFDAMDRFGVDVVRFYLARVGGRFRDDVDWSQEQLEKHADEIKSLLGNFFLRITSNAIAARVAQAPVPSKTFADLLADFEVDPDAANFAGADAHSSGAGTGSSVGAKPGSTSTTNTDVLISLRRLGGNVQRLIAQHEVGEALDEIIRCLKQANAALTHTAPWAKTTPPAHAQVSYLTSLETLRVCGIFLQPYIPGTAARLLDALGVPERERGIEWTELGRGEVGRMGGVVRGVKLFEFGKGVTEKGK
ncbi:tRNA synthetases class I (M)-domain-containing protein [Hygrophoropsis aurantiaca]|uniref:tRNA synthetases class I (M)-domain-containing protein n=1 Tax=Hygrophoropsis aurantiaca TaxID=72124 RepID=A0ACB8AGF0_9AGAM|nr:tRNA synthetases class I (M)-domain-containing protein [Hygrophoropsis aurantiaca]